MSEEKFHYETDLQINAEELTFVFYVKVFIYLFIYVLSTY